MVVAALLPFARPARVTRSAFLVVSALLAVACGGVDGAVDVTEPDRSETSRALPPPANVDESGSSSEETRAAVCALQAQKRCLERVELDACEEQLSVFTEGFVKAYGRCIEDLGSCDAHAALQNCEKAALGEVAPGFPELPIIERCKAKNRSCSTAYPRDARIEPRVDEACEAIVALESSARARSEACLAEQGCKQFATCLRNLY